jgi:hypothetical protein
MCWCSSLDCVRAVRTSKPPAPILRTAWNGQVLPGAALDRSKPAMFLPYYVPEGMQHLTLVAILPRTHVMMSAGDRSIDDTSPLLHIRLAFVLQHAPML